jgi:hypothetical protein
MTTSTEAGGVVNALRGTLRRAGLAMSPTMVRQAGRAVVTAAELALTQMGAPGALACCEYLAGWWGHCERRGTSRQRTANRPCHVAPASATAACDHERS